MRRQYHFRRIGGDLCAWDLHRLIRLSRGIAPEELALEAFAELDQNWWYGEAAEPPTPRALAGHMALVQQADLRFPVLIAADGGLIDGMHRLVRALLEGQSRVQAIRLPALPEPDYINIPPEALPYPDEEI